jgi:hypothetical protein
MGRSGTTWLARLLNQDRSVRVHHEPLPSHDRRWYALCYREPWRAVEWLGRRRVEMARIQARHPDGADYAEVNSYLRYAVPELREAFPGAAVVGLVRDGRATVRSLLALGCYQRPGYPEIPPLPGLEQTGALAQCCGYWAHAYRVLWEQDVALFRLEDLNAGYGVFSGLCERVGASVDEETWARHAGRPANAGRRDEWAGAWDEGVFQAIAGDVQRGLYP